MRGAVAAAAVIGTLAIGGLPALALTLAADETAPSSAARSETGSEGNGPPPWAAAHGHDKDRKAERKFLKDEAKADRGHRGRSPHGWAVREWAHCLGDAAAELEDGERLDPHQACGGKPGKPARPDR